jgi:hypothetical protein
MSTQKSKFELFSRLQALGFTYDESAALRRVEMTLQRWAETECGDGNDHGSWAIERDEKTGKPYMVHHHYTHGRGTDYTTRRPIADREAGALRRAKAIVDARNARKPFGAENLHFYHQTDPRGCALYVLRESDIPGGTAEAETNYTRGLAVCA